MLYYVQLKKSQFNLLKQLILHSKLGTKIYHDTSIILDKGMMLAPTNFSSLSQMSHTINAG